MRLQAVRRQTDSPLGVCFEGPLLRRNDQSLQGKQGDSQPAFPAGSGGSHREGGQRRRHSQIPVQGGGPARRQPGGNFRHRIRGHPGRRPPHPVRVIPGRLRHELRILHDRPRGLPRAVAGRGHPQPVRFHRRGRLPHQRRFHGDGRAPEQLRRRFQGDRGPHCRLGVRMEPQAHHRLQHRRAAPAPGP